jgi:hypothetical protein
MRLGAPLEREAAGKRLPEPKARKTRLGYAVAALPAVLFLGAVVRKSWKGKADGAAGKQPPR